MIAIDMNGVFGDLVFGWIWLVCFVLFGVCLGFDCLSFAVIDFWFLAFVRVCFVLF